MIFIGSKKKFFEKYVTVEEHCKKIAELKFLNDQLHRDIDKATDDLCGIVNDPNHYFKVGIGDTVYDVQYRTKSGRFCSKKEKASRSKTSYVEKEVTVDNFMSVQQALANKEMFATELEAIRYIETLSE